MTPSDVEVVYEALANAIDRVGPDQSELFLAKLALLLSREVGSAEKVLPLVTEAVRHLTPPE